MTFYEKYRGSVMCQEENFARFLLPEYETEEEIKKNSSGTIISGYIPKDLRSNGDEAFIGIWNEWFIKDIKDNNRNTFNDVKPFVDSVYNAFLKAANKMYTVQKTSPKSSPFQSVYVDYATRIMSKATVWKDSENRFVHVTDTIEVRYPDLPRDCNLEFFYENDINTLSVRFYPRKHTELQKELLKLGFTSTKEGQTKFHLIDYVFNLDDLDKE